MAYHDPVIVSSVSKEVSVGRVLRNVKDEARVVVHVHRGEWNAVHVVHKPLYLTHEGVETLEVTDRRVEASKGYTALVHPVELLSGGEIRAGDSRKLLDGGWKLRVSRNEVQAVFFQAQEKLESILRAYELDGFEGVSFKEPFFCPCSEEELGPFTQVDFLSSASSLTSESPTMSFSPKGPTFFALLLS